VLGTFAEHHLEAARPALAAALYQQKAFSWSSGLLGQTDTSRRDYAVRWMPLLLLVQTNAPAPLRGLQHPLTKAVQARQVVGSLWMTAFRTFDTIVLLQRVLDAPMSACQLYRWVNTFAGRPVVVVEPKKFHPFLQAQASAVKLKPAGFLHSRQNILGQLPVGGIDSIARRLATGDRGRL